jgi:ABC-type uncharacterized transport system auxiliary subunit
MKYQIAALTGIAIALSACGGGLLTSTQKTPTAYYLLHPSYQTESNVPARAVSADAKVLQVVRPVVPAGFDTDRIALYVNNGRRLDYYADARWPSRLDELLREFTTSSLRGAFPDLIVDTGGLDVSPQYKLAMKIVHFEPIYGASTTGAPLLKAEILFTLIRVRDEHVLTQFTLAQQVQAQGDDLSTITAGLEGLLQQISRDAFTQVAPYLVGRKAEAETDAAPPAETGT